VNHVILDAADAVELIEILECFLADARHTRNHGTGTPLRGCRGYHTDDLRADLMGLEPLAELDSRDFRRTPGPRRRAFWLLVLGHRRPPQARPEPSIGRGRSILWTMFGVPVLDYP
jgi:hypothetical protein